MLHIRCYIGGWVARMGLRTFLHRADQAVEDTKQSVTTSAVIAVAALVIAAVALVVVITRR